MRYLILFLASALLASCANDEGATNTASSEKAKSDSAAVAKKQADSIAAAEAIKKPAIQYHFEKKDVWKLKDSFEGDKHRELLAAINRVDATHLKYLDSFLAPDQYSDSIADYLPFPKALPFLSDVNKIIIFSYPTQTFAAYEKGRLILTGPTNMGKKSSKTPTGLFFCNWKSKETRSTVDRSWVLKWNFNVSNLGGVGFHQYALPGYPASHSCMRLWADQAKFLYDWAEQWKLQGDALIAKGTPVVIYGEYPFGEPRPWYALAQDPKALDITEEQLKDVIRPHLDEILKAQEARAAVSGHAAPAADTAKKVDTAKRVVGA